MEGTDPVIVFDHIVVTWPLALLAINNTANAAKKLLLSKELLIRQLVLVVEGELVLLEGINKNDARVTCASFDVCGILVAVVVRW